MAVVPLSKECPGEGTQNQQVPRSNSPDRITRGTYASVVKATSVCPVTGMDVVAEGVPVPQKSRGSRPSSPADTAHKRCRSSDLKPPPPPSDILAGGTPVMNGEGC